MKNESFKALLDVDHKKTTEARIKLKNEAQVLVVKPANTWTEEASLRPMPKELFSSFWFEGEICILFADTNCGKSILAVQIINAITRGFAMFNFKAEAPPQKVLYLDFELSDNNFKYGIL